MFDGDSVNSQGVSMIFKSRFVKVTICGFDKRGRYDAFGLGWPGSVSVWWPCNC